MEIGHGLLRILESNSTGRFDSHIFFDVSKGRCEDSRLIHGHPYSKVTTKSLRSIVETVFADVVVSVDLGSHSSGHGEHVVNSDLPSSLERSTIFLDLRSLTINLGNTLPEWLSILLSHRHSHTINTSKDIQNISFTLWGSSVSSELFNVFPWVFLLFLSFVCIKISLAVLSIWSRSFKIISIITSHVDSSSARVFDNSDIFDHLWDVHQSVVHVVTSKFVLHISFKIFHVFEKVGLGIRASSEVFLRQTNIGTISSSSAAVSLLTVPAFNHDVSVGRESWPVGVSGVVEYEWLSISN